ncbi:MAG: PTS fructose transporter subunit IIA [Coprobacillus sp.]
MKYVVLVSHGQFAVGLADSLRMLAGKRDDLIAVGLSDGKSADEFSIIFEQAIADIKQNDEIILLGDLIGGSPLTTAMNVIDKKGMTSQSVIIGGMNLPLALTTILMKDTLSIKDLPDQVLNEACSSLKELKVVVEDEEEI